MLINQGLVLGIIWSSFLTHKKKG